MFRNLIKRMLRRSGYELCRYSAWELEEAAELGWSLDSLNYKDFQAARALSAGSHISIDEARFLMTLVERTAADEPIIEVGTLFGASTLAMLMSKKKEQQLITVDKYVWNPLGISPDAHALATAALLKEACSDHNVTVIRQDKDDFYQSYQGPRPGLFFCDADHDYEPTIADLRWARAVGAGIICGHDYDPSRHPGVVRAVEELGGPRDVVGSVFVL